jgi:hypothetical protein
MALGLDSKDSWEREARMRELISDLQDREKNKIEFRCKET